MKIHRLVLMIVLTITSVVTTAEEFDLGTLGATIELDESWERRVINPDLGSDQFVSIKGFWCFVTQFQGLLDSRSDLDRLASTIIDSLPTTMEVLENQPATHHEEVDGIIRVTRRMSVRMSGLKLVYQFDAVGRDGLAYLFMTWSTASRETDLHDWASRVARSLRMPPPESDWGKSAVPASHEHRFGDRVVELDYRPSLLVDYWVEDDSDMTTVATLDDELAVHLAIFANTDPPDIYLDDVVEYFDEAAASINEIDRSDVEVEFGRGRQIRCEFTDAEGSYVFALAAIPVTEDLILDLRMVVMASAWGDDREELWSSLVSSIRITEDPKVDAFPQPTETSTDSIALNEAAQAILDQSTALAASWGWNNLHLRAPDGRVFAHEGDRIVILNDGGEGEEQSVIEFPDWVSNRALGWWNTELVTLNSDNEVAAVGDGLEPLGISARTMAVIDDDRLIIVPDREPPEVLGYEHLPIIRPTEVVVHHRGGETHRIAELEGESVQYIAVSPDGLTTLIALRAEAGLELQLGGTSTELRLLDLHEANPRQVGVWQTITGITASATGWLVSGSPTDGPNGLYLVDDGGGRELLMTGEVDGLSLTDGTLVYATNLHISDGYEGGPPKTVYESPLDLIREFGPLVRPFTVETINLIAAEAAATTTRLPTLEGLQTFLATADRASQAIAGLPLPSGAASVDRLLTDVSYDTDLSSDAIDLLSAMSSAALVEAGARWVDGSATSTNMETWANGWIGDSLFSVAIRPHQVVVNTLYSEEGWWKPVSSILESAAGRSILIGIDEDALETVLETVDSPETIGWIESAKQKKIARLIEENPDNSHLRKQIYLQLASRSEFEVMESLSDSVIREGEPAAEDWRAWAAVRHQLADPNDDTQLEISRLREAIGGNPDDPSLYLLLGATYERSKLKDRSDLARACYLRVTELRTWGLLSKEAQSGLERVDGSSTAD